MDGDGLKLTEPGDFRLNGQTDGDQATQAARAGSLSRKISRIFENADVPDYRQIQYSRRRQGDLIGTTLIQVDDIRSKLQTGPENPDGGPQAVPSSLLMKAVDIIWQDLDLQL
jgi:hypothetical protein